MRWRIINKIYSNKTDAEKRSRELNSKGHNAKVVYDGTTVSWMVVMEEDNDREKIETIKKWYKEHGYDAYLQKVKIG